MPRRRSNHFFTQFRGHVLILILTKSFEAGFESSAMLLMVDTGRSLHTVVVGGGMYEFDSK